MRTVLIGLGSNSYAEENLAKAKKRICQCFSTCRFSSIRKTPPNDGKGGPDYLNQVAACASAETPDAIKQLLRQIEAELGRDRSTPETVAIDLDFLALGLYVDPTLKLPSPELTQRDYYLQGALELVPDFLHPIFFTTLSAIANRKKQKICEETE